MEVEIEVEGSLALGRSLFGQTPIPIPRPGDTAAVPGGGRLRLERFTERRGGDAVQTFDMWLNIASNGATLVMFTGWLVRALLADPNSRIRIEGREVSKDEASILAFLKSLEQDHRSQ